MQPQQIPQVQMIPQNMQNPQANPAPHNQNLQVIQTEAPNTCEKFSKFLTGTANIPFTVFIILMSSFGVLIISNLFSYYFFSYIVISSFSNLIFAIFVWSKMAIKIEMNTSTVKYCYLYLVNLFILSLITLTSPIARIWNFVLFETILISLNNKDKRIKFFCCKYSGNLVIVVSIIYHIIFNSLDIIPILITIGYAYVYNKWLIQKLNISNEKIELLENSCFIKFLRDKFQTFITLRDVLNKEKNKQPLVPNNANDNVHNNNINNPMQMSSFIPLNMYPNYYSGIIPNPNPNDSPIQVQPMQQMQPVNPVQVPPVVDINQPA